jgi:hypothetical protein
LQAYLDNVTTEDITRLFGEPDPGGYVDDEKGYDGREYLFTDGMGNVVNIYSRFGNWRVGAHDEQVAAEFKRELYRVLGKTDA